MRKGAAIRWSCKIAALGFAILIAIPSKTQKLSNDLVSLADLQSAIDRALDEKDKLQGLELVDAAQASPTTGRADGSSSTGYRVVVYTPLAWIKEQASIAAKERRPFSISNISDDMRQTVLRVVVYSGMPASLTAAGEDRAGSVEQVVLRDATRISVVQPVREDNFSYPDQNALGATVEYRGVAAVFPLVYVEQLCDENEQFFVTVVGEQGQRDFKIRRKQLLKLPFGRIPPAVALVSRPAIRDSAPQPAVALRPSKVEAGSDGSTASAAGPPSALEQCIESLKKVDAAFEVSATDAVLLTALIDAQVRFDEVQRQDDKQNTPLTIESASIALDGFKLARTSKKAQDLAYADDALETAIQNLKEYKSSGHELAAATGVAGGKFQRAEAQRAPQRATVPPRVEAAATDRDKEPSIGAWFFGKRTARHDGAKIAAIEQGGPLDEVGVQAGDVILSLAGRYVYTIDDLHAALLSHAADAQIAIKYRRRLLEYETVINLRPSQPAQ